METMLYKYPANEGHITKVEVDGDNYHYKIVTDDLVDAEVEAGWFKHFVEAKQAFLDKKDDEDEGGTTRKRKPKTDGVD